MSQASLGNFGKDVAKATAGFDEFRADLLAHPTDQNFNGIGFALEMFGLKMFG